MENFILACIHLDPLAIIRAGGYVGIALIVFAESGVLLGVIFPGDSLLFAAGLIAALGVLNFPALAAIVVAAAILGDSAGYWFGARIGPRLFTKEESFFFKRDYIIRTQKFYAKYGPRAIVLARFVPVVRTLAPILAGVGAMPYRRFLAYNALGGLLWGFGMTLLGYTLGSAFPAIEHYIFPLSLVIIFVSFLPILLNIFQKKSES